MSILLRFDPEGGDLGRGIKVTALEMAIVAPHVANILQALHDEVLTKLFFANPMPHFKYGFEIWLGDKDRLEYAIHDIEKELPSNVHWYAADNHKYFELRGASGGITIALACYLYTA